MSKTVFSRGMNLVAKNTGRAEFLLKRLARWLLTNVKLPDYQPRKPFLRQLKGFLDDIWAHDKRSKPMWANAESFLLRLADNDPAYYDRLLAVVVGLQSVKFELSDLDTAIVKAYFDVPVNVGA